MLRKMQLLNCKDCCNKLVRRKQIKQLQPNRLLEKKWLCRPGKVHRLLSGRQSPVGAMVAPFGSRWLIDCCLVLLITPRIRTSQAKREARRATCATRTHCCVLWHYTHCTSLYSAHVNRMPISTCSRSGNWSTCPKAVDNTDQSAVVLTETTTRTSRQVCQPLLYLSYLLCCVTKWPNDASKR